MLDLTKSRPIIDGPDRFALLRGPNFVYLSDGRMIPIRDDRSDFIGAIDNRKPVVHVHCRAHDGERLGGAVLGVDVEE